MKIDFAGEFEQIRRILTAPAQPAEVRPEDFSKLLGGVSPSAQPPVNKKDSPIHGRIDTSRLAQERSTMARFQPPQPELKLPQIFAPSDNADLSIAVNEPPDDVNKASPIKAPRILKASRVSSKEGANQGLSLEHRIGEVKELVQAAGKKHGVDPALSLAVVANESSFNPNAVSSDGYSSKGLFQLLDSTGKDMVDRLDVKARYNPFNPHLNVELGVGYLRYLHDIFSRETDLPNKLHTVAAANSASLEKLAVAAFNAGEGRVASAQERALRAGADPSNYDQIRSYLPEMTQQYVDRVMAARGGFEGRFID